MIPFADLRHGDCREMIATLDDNSIDAIVTDPPYELGFMGKKWDNTGIAYDVNLWTQCLRVLKPGGHLLAFGGTRTYHRMASAIEDAGFEIRDSIHWLYGSGFPKSHDVSKAIDKAAGAKRQVVGQSKKHSNIHSFADSERYSGTDFHLEITAPATDASREWEGWGTALKPAHEPIVVARKPLIGTVAANVLDHGTGALNIDGARVPSNDGYEKQWDRPVTTNIGAVPQNYDIGINDGECHTIDISANKPTGGRWPANVITDGSIDTEWVRYFYCAKPSKAERNAGLDALPKIQGGSYEGRVDGSLGQVTAAAANHHPTVKPLALMRYLVRLVTPPGGTVLEPFAGSGTTMAAAILEGFDVIGCELTADYLPIIEGRIAWAQQQHVEAHDNLFGESA